VALGCFVAPEARSITIDAWTTEQTTTVSSPASSASTVATGAGVLGGEREISVTRASGPVVTMSAASGSLAYGQIAGALGTGSVIWDGVDGGGALDPTGLGGVDFTDAATSTEISIPLLFSDLPGVLRLTAYTDGANASQFTMVLPGSIPPDPQSVLTILFSSFGVLAGSGADFSNIGAFVLEVDGSSQAGLDFETGVIQTIATPELQTAFLLGAGLMGLSLRARRRVARTRR
jgi:hypothetical protein